jgi:hypothetical protein
MRSILNLFRWIYLWHLMLACIGLWSVATMSSWSRATDWGVMYNPEGSPVPAKDMAWAIEYAIDAWTSRVDQKSMYLGITGETEKDGYIVVQWKRMENEDGKIVNGAARWTWLKSDGSDVRVEIFMNPDGITNAKDACFLDTLVHEFGHAFGIRGKPGTPGDSRGHSYNPDDVMYEDRGECRPSLSLYDISMLQKPLKSCHVELTPSGDLEALDYKGQRVRLIASGKDAWGSPRRSSNYLPSPCNSVVMRDGEFWLDVRSFELGAMVLRLRPEGNSFKSIPLN